MTRPTILGLIGALFIIAAISFTFFVEPDLKITLPGIFAGSDSEKASDKKADQATAAEKTPSDTAAGGANSSESSNSKSPAAEPSGPIAPSFDVVRVNPEGDTVIAGRAAPNSEVIVRSGDTVIGRVKSDARGEWVLIPEKPLPPGNRELTLSSPGPDGKEIEASRSVIILVPEKGKDIAGKPADGTSGPMTLLVPRDGSGTEVIQRPGDVRSNDKGATSDSQLPQTVSVDSVDYDGEGRVTINGVAPPLANLNVYLENKLVGRGRADEKGRWRLVPGQPLMPGAYTLRVDQISPDGKVLSRAETKFVRPEQSTVTASKNVVEVVRGNSLWQIARRQYGKGYLYTVIYEANRNQIRDPDLIYPGQVFFVPHGK